MSKIGNIRVDVAASDAAYYAYAPHDSVTLSIARTRCPATCGGHTASRSSTKPAKSSRRA